MPETLLKTVNISKEFSGVRVLNNINVEIKKGEIMGIIGENGAGKSTLIKIINGTHQPTEGQVIFAGQTEKMDIKKAKDLGIRTIPQEFNLINHLNVYENIFLGQEYKKGVLLDKQEMKAQTKQLLDDLDTELDSEKKIGSLSVADKQMVEIAKATAYNSKLLIMDEPTTVLTPFETNILFDLMKKLRANGVTIIYISHKLAEVKKICDRVMVLRDGEMISVDPIDNLDEQQMANRMVGRELNQMFPAKSTPGQEKVLQAKHLTVPGLLEDISFDLYKGEVLGLFGLIGAGRTELAETIIGVRDRSEGTIIINGQEVDITSPVDAVVNKIAYLSEDRQGAGILTNFDLPSNITLVSLPASNRFFIDRDEEKKKAEEYIDRFNIRTPSMHTQLKNLSGGNQQKVSIAKSLDIGPEIFIMDEPTRGIDVNAKMEIFKFIHELVNSGISCLFISSELEEILGMCNRVLVMRTGELTGILEDENINEQEIMYYATGIKGGRTDAYKVFNEQ